VAGLRHGRGYVSALVNGDSHSLLVGSGLTVILIAVLWRNVWEMRQRGLGHQLVMSVGSAGWGGGWIYDSSSIGVPLPPWGYFGRKIFGFNCLLGISVCKIFTRTGCVQNTCYQ